MIRLHVPSRSLSVPVSILNGGGVVDARLVSYYACPRCKKHLRFMAVFETTDDAVLALAGLRDVRIEAVRTGQVISATELEMGQYGPKHHGTNGQPSGYGANACDLVPFLGEEMDLARQIWKALHKGQDKVVPPLPSGRVDLTRLGVVHRVKDEVNPRNAPLLLYKGDFLQAPHTYICGRWDGHESYERWTKRLEESPQLFFRRVSLSDAHRLTT